MIPLFYYGKFRPEHSPRHFWELIHAESGERERLDQARVFFFDRSHVLPDMKLVETCAIIGKNEHGDFRTQSKFEHVLDDFGL